jgi:hypothetical protein
MECGIEREYKVSKYIWRMEKYLVSYEIHQIIIKKILAHRRHIG